jgi:hypothetical protein
MVVATDAAAGQSQPSPPAITLVPPGAPRWDVAGHVGWFGSNESEVAPSWNRWADSASVGGSVGFYATPHLKLELDVATTNEADLFTQDQILVPGAPPIFVSRQLFFRSTTVGAAVAYQFFENAWFHPFLAAGAEGVHRRQHTELLPQYIPVPGRPGTFVPGALTEPRTVATARPFAATGFKAYVSDRAFIRTDVRISFTDQADAIVWRGGVGFDF